MKNLVIYYSRKGENYVNGKIKNIDKGNTEYIAEFLKEDLGADLFKAETRQYLHCRSVLVGNLSNGHLLGDRRS